MAECIKCGIEDNKALLFDVISPKGIVKICRKCNVEEEFPLIKKAPKIEGIEEKKGVYERLSKYAGIDAEKHKRRFEIDKKEELVRRQNTNLRDLIDKNFKKKVVEDKNPELKDKLIHNFHWVVMRATIADVKALWG